MSDGNQNGASSLQDTGFSPGDPGLVPALRGQGLTKRYSGVTVVDQVDIDARAGMIRAVIGENGAGKSTLMKMLTGDVIPDGGTIYQAGQPVAFRNPRQANLHGIAMVHQELQLMPLLSVADNLMLVNPPETLKIRRRTRAEQGYVRQQLGRVGLRVDPATPVSTLSVAQAQLLEIAKALALNAKVIIFDEPTSALPLHEVERLLALIEGLRAEGHAILYISHHLPEVLRLADVITVMRDTCVVGEFRRGEATEADLIQLMVARQVGTRSTGRTPYRDEVVFAADQVATKSVQGVSFTLHRGEILGFAGLMGSGMQAAASALVGDSSLSGGFLTLAGKPVRFKNPYAAVRHGVVIVPEDRKRDGIVPDGSVADNCHLGRMGRFGRWGVLDRRRMQTAALEIVRRFDIRLKSLQQPIKTLSGGNQQKVIVGRCVQTSPEVLILCEPTRGVDVAAKDDIHQHILRLAASGTSIIVVSSELDEVLALSHRVVVFSEGRMAGILDGMEATPVAVMSLATPKRNQTNGENGYVHHGTSA